MKPSRQLPPASGSPHASGPSDPELRQTLDDLGSQVDVLFDRLIDHDSDPPQDAVPVVPDASAEATPPKPEEAVGQAAVEADGAAERALMSATPGRSGTLGDDPRPISEYEALAALGDRLRDSIDADTPPTGDGSDEIDVGIKLPDTRPVDSSPVVTLVTCLPDHPNSGEAPDEPVAIPEQITAADLAEDLNDQLDERFDAVLTDRAPTLDEAVAIPPAPTPVADVAAPLLKPRPRDSGGRWHALAAVVVLALIGLAFVVLRMGGSKNDGGTTQASISLDAAGRTPQTEAPQEFPPSPPRLTEPAPARNTEPDDPEQARETTVAAVRPPAAPKIVAREPVPAPRTEVPRPKTESRPTATPAAPQIVAPKPAQASPPIVSNPQPPAPQPAAEPFVEEVIPPFQPPEALERVEPIYPPRARKKGQGGSVTLNVMVSEDGRVVRVVVEQGLPGSELEAAAIDAVLRWRYRPAQENGHPIRGWTSETFVFEP